MKKQNPFILVLALLLPIFIAGSIASFQKYRKVAAEFFRQEKRLTQLLEEREALQKTIEYFSSSINIEKEARERFNFMRPGEVTVILVSPKPKSSPEPSPTPSPFYLKFFQWFRMP
jgi:cell division protein FtsB